MPTNQPIPDTGCLGEKAREALDAADGLAQLTGHPAIGAGHLALALLSVEESAFDALLDEAFGGLRSASIAESLLDILEIEAELSEEAKPPEDGIPPAERLSRQAAGAVERAAQIAAGWGLGRTTGKSLAGALFENPSAQLSEAFQDAGVSSAELRDLGARMVEAGPPAPPTAPPVVFSKGAVQLRAFGSVAGGAVAALARTAAGQPGGRFGDADLLARLLEQEGSRLTEAFHVMGLPVASIRRNLTRDAAPPGPASGAAPELPAERLSRLLRRVLNEASTLAAAEGCTAISESHLVRAHLGRVAGGAANLYQRLGIDTLRLRDYLRRYPSDPEPAEPAPETTPVEVVRDIEEYLRSRVINQDSAIRSAVPALRRVRVGLAEPGRPAGIFLFLGPTGVGKTELTRAIAEVAFGEEAEKRDPYLIKLDCGNFTEPRDIVQLLGAPQGLVGYKEGQLTNGLKEKPRAVILFDEAEKANPQLWQSLLPLFDEGFVREADGTEYDATECIVIATSNLGYGEAIERFQLWEREADDEGTLPTEVTDFVWEQVQTYFSPEFRGRFGRENVLFFNHFNRPSYRAIVCLQLDKLLREMAGRGYDVTVPDAAVDLLTDLAWERREEGARPVRRLLTLHVRDQIVNGLLADPQRTRFAFTALTGRGEILLES